MTIRVRGLGIIDLLAVPLPVGTEVTTRVDREVGDRRVPQGAVGRIAVVEHDGLVDVRIVGIAGLVTYRRDEVLPRRSGQLRFAARRADAWAALAPCAVIESIVGSRAWGLANEGSDTDRRGVYVAPFPWTAGLDAAPEELTSADGSATVWEIGKAVRQGLRADPNTLEMLFVDGARALDPMGEWLLEARDVFVSAEIYGAFGRYAVSQVAKLRQSLRLAEHRALVLEWLRREPTLGLDELAARLARAAKVEAPNEADARLRAKEYVKQLYHSLHDQGLSPAASLAGLVTVAQAGATDLTELPRELRPKNAYNLLRLMATAIGWLESGVPTFVVVEPLRSRLLAVKRGEVALGDVLDEAEALAPALEAARAGTKLPQRGDVAGADAVLRRVREEAARRWAAGAAGPWGRDAAATPAIAWEEHE